MFEWLKKHSNHQIVVRYEDKPEIGIKRFWCICRDCKKEDWFDYIRRANENNRN